MPRTTLFNVDVHFGDCDPAGIVFFPNFSRWMDSASLAFFMACGVPPWRELVKTRGIVGTPLLEIHTKFIKAVTYGERITIATHVEEWRAKVFVQLHRVTRGDDVFPRESPMRRTIATRTAPAPAIIQGGFPPVAGSGTPASVSTASPNPSADNVRVTGSRSGPSPTANATSIRNQAVSVSSIRVIVRFSRSTVIGSFCNAREPSQVGPVHRRGHASIRYVRRFISSPSLAAASSLSAPALPQSRT